MNMMNYYLLENEHLMLRNNIKLYKIAKEKYSMIVINKMFIIILYTNKCHAFAIVQILFQKAMSTRKIRKNINESSLSILLHHNVVMETAHLQKYKTPRHLFLPLA